MDKRVARLRRASRTRFKIRELGVDRLTVHRTPQHTYAQVIDAKGKVVASASTLEKSLRETLKSTSNADAARVIGETVAQRAVEKGCQKVAFDRSGFKYHGRIKALADAARNAGLLF